MFDPTKPAIVDLSWSSLPPEQHNGIILGYLVMAIPSQGDSRELNISADLEEVQLTGLTLNVFYNFSVAAFTSAGVGPAASMQILLLPGGWYFRLLPC